ncbi:hypothetical protein HDU96_000580 [Phlyctochytrium bullatum]|nr:hypothetical protein HDU96_000580 [Phlyctochytrium bullatum]
MDEILLNVQLRHDLYFDPNLQFKPNVEGERGEQKKQRANEYWSELEDEISGFNLYRLPLCIIIELLPYSDEMRDDVERNIDVRLIAQEIEHNVLDVNALMVYIAQLLRANCAPARDGMLDEMMAACLSGKFTNALRLCFDVLEMMKLDYANHQLHRIRPYVVEHAIEFERNWFKDNAPSLSITKAWIAEGFKRYRDQNGIQAESRMPSLLNVYVSNLLHLIGQSPILAEGSKISALLPETLTMDAVRLVTYRNDWQDLTIMAALLILYRQAAGGKCDSAQLLAMKRNLWVLLNDAETSMQHIVLEIAKGAGTIRGRPFTSQESSLLSGMVDKTLSPESRLYSMICSRIGEHITSWVASVLETSAGVSSKVAHAKNSGIATFPVCTTELSIPPDETSSQPPARTACLDKVKVAKHGLAELEDEICDLADRIGKFAEFNRATYFEFYATAYEEVRGEIANSAAASVANCSVPGVPFAASPSHRGVNDASASLALAKHTVKQSGNSNIEMLPVIKQ